MGPPPDGAAGSSVLKSSPVPPALIDTIAAIEAEFALVMGRPERVADGCERLREARLDWSTVAMAAPLDRITALLRSRTGSLAAPLLAFVGDTLPAASEPWVILRGLAGSRDATVCRWALDRAVELADAGSLTADPGLAETLAAASDQDDAPINETETLARVARLLKTFDLLAIYSDHGDLRLRRLAARLLDLSAEPPAADVAARVLGAAAAAFLEPYLAFTRASHGDLLDLASPDDEPPAAIASLRHAQATCGFELVRDVIAALGWRRVAGGLEARRQVGVSIGGGFPLVLTPAEASLLEGRPDAERAFERVLFIAHGGARAGLVGTVAGDDAVQRFRAYNLAHADALADILDVAPLTIEKVHRILDRMARIVEGFIGLFGSHDDECAVIADIHAKLAQRIRRELDTASSDGPLSPELTRLVQMFEDPQSPGAVRTMHGLKRYLHQRGLRLGFRLAETGRSTDRTVDLVLASDRRVLQVAHAVEYVDFEDGPTPAPDAAAPYAVTLVAEAFGRQMLHGQTTLPKVRAFCYGNEVHYFVGFRNHPAFVRVDYSPPARGGMVDLEYFGVSKYEMSAHPNVSLDGIRAVFERLDFDVEIEHTRVRARYDKERSPDLSDLCDKVALLFHLIPYLMDVDWVVGNLSLDDAARHLVAAAWADFFARWSALPMEQFMTADRQGILAAVEPAPEGVREVRWPGTAPYRDRFTVDAPSAFWSGIAAAIASRGLAALPAVDDDEPVCQLAIDRHVLVPLRRAVGRGEILDTGVTLAPAPPDRFRREHEAARFARLLAGDTDAIARSAQLARLISHLERIARFETTGTLNGYPVQRTMLPLRGEPLALYVLVDAAGIPRLAFFAADAALYVRLTDAQDGWMSNAEFDVEALAARLRRDNVPAEWIAPPPGTAYEIAERIRSVFAVENTEGLEGRSAGERLVEGLKASPGRAVGVARLGTAGRRPSELEGGVLVAPALSPDDNALLFRAAGILSTGGGILSHAGLLAMQFGKPALVIEGTWRQTASGTPVVVYRTVEHDERTVEVEGYAVTERYHFRVRDDEIREGDLLVVDADLGHVLVLGQDPQALSLNDELRQLATATRRLARASADTDIVAERGNRLRARHQLEKLLGRLTSPVLVRHAVRELLVGEAIGGATGARDDRTLMLRRLLANPAVQDEARAAVERVARDLAARATAARDRALRLVPLLDDPHEILWLRLTAVKLQRTLTGVRESLAECRIELGTPPGDGRPLDALVADRLAALRRRLLGQARRSAAPDGYLPPLRHVLGQIAWLDLALGTPEPDRADTGRLQADLAARDAATLARASARRVVTAADGGRELRALVGSKAANLAEAARLGHATVVPGWFVVTDRAFREVMAAPAPAGGGTLATAIDEVVARADLTDAEKSQLIRRSWETVRLPADLVREVVAAYRALAGRDDGDVPVAVRSSAREEDTEAAARAGEFDTFLFVRGEGSLVERLRRAWSGLWTERALHNRGRAGIGDADVGGGVLIQRMVDARVSGVLHTVNVAEGRLDEMVLNAGLGLGEGIVSGAVAADLVVVSKEDSLASSRLRFRYMTADKRERVVFNARTGSGTTRESTLYHQRLRPALEYVELCELVQAAARLEWAFGQPLDIEFAIEGTTLWVLQIRPVPAAVSVWRETIAHHPLSTTGHEAHHDSA